MSLWTLAEETLAECEQLLAQTVTRRTLPERRYVSHGQPPVEDCDGVLVVWLPQVETRQVAARDAGQTMRVAGLAIDVWRCWPTGDTHPPKVSDLSEAALTLVDDVDRLTEGLAGFLADRCASVEWRAAQPLGPLGGLAGWRLQVGVSF